VARPGLLLVGDAAAQVDPAAGQGVLFALESGLRAAQVVAACSETPALTALHLARYDEWAMHEFERKTAALTAMYRDLGIDAALAIQPA
jgi:flavin-dependent dehydrogenase